MLHEENKKHGLDTYMWNSSQFQNTITIVHKQLSRVFALAVKKSSCIAVLLSSQHQWNNPATSWSQHRRGSCKKHKSLDNKCLTKASCNRRQGGAGRDQSTFSEENHLKERLDQMMLVVPFQRGFLWFYEKKIKPAYLKGSSASEKLFPLIHKMWCVSQAEEEQRAGTQPCFVPCAAPTWAGIRPL